MAFNPTDFLSMLQGGNIDWTKLLGMSAPQFQTDPNTNRPGTQPGPSQQPLQATSFNTANSGGYTPPNIGGSAGKAPTYSIMPVPSQPIMQPTMDWNKPPRENSGPVPQPISTDTPQRSDSGPAPIIGGATGRTPGYGPISTDTPQRSDSGPWQAPNASSNPNLFQITKSSANTNASTIQPFGSPSQKATTPTFTTDPNWKVPTRDGSPTNQLPTDGSVGVAGNANDPYSELKKQFPGYDWPSMPAVPGQPGQTTTGSQYGNPNLPVFDPNNIPEDYKPPQVDWSKIPLNKQQFQDYMNSNRKTLDKLYYQSGAYYKNSPAYMSKEDFAALMYTRNGGGNLPDYNSLTYEQAYGLLGDMPPYASKTPKYDWATDVPGILQQMLQKVMNSENPNPTDVAYLWMADVVGNLPNLSRAYTENVNNFITGTNQRIENTEGFFNHMMQQYGMSAEEAKAAYNKLQGQGDEQIGALNALISNIGSEFGQSLANQRGDYAQLLNLFDQLGASGTQEYKDFISKFENALAKQEGEYQGFAGQGQDLYDYVMGNYGDVRNTTNDITKAIMDAYQRTVTGEVGEATKANIDEIFKHNQDLINQNFDETLEKERRQLVDQMAGRGILTSGVTGRAYNDMTEQALREKQRSLSEISAQRAATMLEMPFKQAEYANQLNQHADTLRNLTSSEANDLMNILQNNYGMSRQNAELALQNITNQANLFKDKLLLDQNQLANRSNLFAQNYGLEQGNLNSMFGQQNTAHGTQAQILANMMSHDANYHNTNVNRLAQQGGFGNQNLQLQQAMAQSIPDTLATMFGQYGGLSQGLLNNLTQRDIAIINAQAQAGNKQSSPNPLAPILGAAIGGGGSCVRKGTKITMADGSFKNAEDVDAGDVVKSFDIYTNAYTTSIIKKRRVASFNHFYNVKLLNGASVEVSSYHPFLIFDGKKYKFGVPEYRHAIKNLIKHIFTSPLKIVDSFKFSVLALKRYCTLKKMHRVMMDNFVNSPVLELEKKNSKDVFFNFITEKGDAPTFIANNIIVEALYDETIKFVDWIGEHGESFDRG